MNSINEKELKQIIELTGEKNFELHFIEIERNVFVCDVFFHRTKEKKRVYSFLKKMRSFRERGVIQFIKKMKQERVYFTFLDDEQ